MGPAPTAVFDLPWMPIYFAILYFVHPTLALTAALELSDRGATRALATMCVGVGQGIALMLEAP